MVRKAKRKAKNGQMDEPFALWQKYWAQQLVIRPIDPTDFVGIAAVLDVGAGTHPFSPAVFPMASRVLCTDIVPSSNVDVVCDAATIPFSDKSFDVVLCLRVLQHLADDRRPLRELFRVTKSKGVAIVAVSNRDSWTMVRARMGNPAWRRRIPYKRYHTYTLTELETRLRWAGFVKVRARSSLFVPEFINRLPTPIDRAIIRSGVFVDRLAGSIPGLRAMGTNLVAWGTRP